VKTGREAVWPSLPLDAWKDTYETLHLWTQVVGKVRLKLGPFVNHWWGVALHVTPRGLSTLAIPYGSRHFEIEFDFVDHVLAIRTDDGQYRAMALAPRPVSGFYAEVMELLGSLNIFVRIDREPKEIPDPIPFDQDTLHASYERGYAHRYWRILSQVDRLFGKFRSGFIGKCSPVNFYWGTFDLTVSRYSGRLAPPRPDADHITQVAYSHEVISCGFWPGSGNVREPAFYAYAAPEPEGFPFGSIGPRSAYYNPETRGYILRYEDVRRSADPDGMVLEFCHRTYDLGAKLGHWDRTALEIDPALTARAA
jgi:hypothetical protein